jgi:hypothetical protein
MREDGSLSNRNWAVSSLDPIGFNQRRTHIRLPIIFLRRPARAAGVLPTNNETPLMVSDSNKWIPDTSGNSRIDFDEDFCLKIVGMICCNLCYHINRSTIQVITHLRPVLLSSVNLWFLLSLCAILNQAMVEIFLTNECAWMRVNAHCSPWHSCSTWNVLEAHSWVWKDIIRLL